MRMHFKPSIKLGLLGAGQLARMISLEAAQWGYQTSVYANNTQEPACSTTDSLTIGSAADGEKLKKFIANCDFVSFESEFFPITQLKDLPTTQKQKFFPALDIIAQIQKRDSQKQLLNRFKIPTARWKQAKDLNFSPQSKDKNLLVLKRIFGGYDGYGTKIFKNPQEVKQFLDSQETSVTEWIAEEKIAFRRELAISIARNLEGHFCLFPLVESIQKQAQCNFVIGPTSHPQLKKVLHKIKTMMRDLNYVGVLSLEFFDCNGDLVVNELAPRVHNSAHHSLDTCSHSQFLIHALCCKSGVLPNPKVLVKKFVMANLVGSAEAPIVQVPDDFSAALHIYAKKENRPRRKMGHFTMTGTNSAALLKKAKKIRQGFIL